MGHPCRGAATVTLSGSLAASCTLCPSKPAPTRTNLTIRDVGLISTVTRRVFPWLVASMVRVLAAGSTTCTFPEIGASSARTVLSQMTLIIASTWTLVAWPLAFLPELLSSGYARRSMAFAREGKDIVHEIPGLVWLEGVLIRGARRSGKAL